MGGRGGHIFWGEGPLNFPGKQKNGGGFPSLQVSEFPSFQVSKFLRRDGGRGDQCLGTDHVGSIFYSHGPFHLLNLHVEEIQAQVKEVDWSPGEDEDCACTNQKTISPPPSAFLTRTSGGLENKKDIFQVPLLVNGLKSFHVEAVYKFLLCIHVSFNAY